VIAHHPHTMTISLSGFCRTGYWQSVFYRLRHDPVTLVFAALVLLIVLAAIFAPCSPRSTPTRKVLSAG